MLLVNIYVYDDALPHGKNGNRITKKKKKNLIWLAPANFDAIPITAANIENVRKNGVNVAPLPRFQKEKKKILTTSNK